MSRHTCGISIGVEHLNAHGAFNKQTNKRIRAKMNAGINSLSNVFAEMPKGCVYSLVFEKGAVQNEKQVFVHTES